MMKLILQFFISKVRLLRRKLRPIKIIINNLRHFYRDKEIMITTNGYELILNRFEYTQHHIANKNYEPEITKFLKKNIKKTDNIVDVGANIGYFTILMAKLTQANVLAFEPYPDNFHRLLRNINLNSLKNIHAYPFALSSSNGRTSLAVTPYNQGGNFILKSASENCQKMQLIDIEMQTLDTVAQDKQINVIKIDVEGHELEVLKGMTNIFSLNSLRFAVIETAGRCAEITEFMGQKNFFPLDMRTGLIKEKIDENELNTIFIRKKS